VQRAHLISSLLGEEGPDITSRRRQVGFCSFALRSLRGRLSRGTGNAASVRRRRTRGTCSASAVQGSKRASDTRRRGSKALDNGAQTQCLPVSSGIQLKAEQRLHSPAHRRRRDSERQETWWLEHWQRESAQGLRARLRRWPGDLQRRVLRVALQCSRRDRAGSATDARASANTPVAQGC
jgi:hypothetical protein